MRSTTATSNVSSSTLLTICISLFQAGALLVTYVYLTRTVSGSDASDDVYVSFVHVVRLFTIIQAINASFYVIDTAILNWILAKITEGHEVKPLF